MAIKELNTGLFWACYLLFIVAILLIPVARNLYYVRKYKISFSAHSRQTINSFCNNVCIYVVKYQDIRGILLVVGTPLCIVMTAAIITIGGKYSTPYLLLMIISNILVHIGFISMYIGHLYDACYMTNTSMLIRGFGAEKAFKKVPLQDVVAYMIYNTHFGGNQELKIFTKDGQRFTLTHLANREEMIDVLKTFTDSTEMKC